ncbi:DUF2690 domain-containing protein [Kitasatospora sp. NPDC036755]|uniref:helix-turn-helix domain-containing protein n=1 Tax=Kitasatospora sp. NPDC036755 TaxID=3154600 RepID=UPI0033F94491
MGAARKQLPEELSEPAKRLAEELRTIKDTAGLSLSELATRTHYSRASWERWLNGKRIVTEQALDALIGTVACDGAALRTLWRQAVAEPVPDGGPEPGACAEPGVGAAVQRPAADDEPRSPEEPPATEAGFAAGEQAAAEAPAAGPEPDPAPWWLRPTALISGAAVLALLLVLVGLRISRHDGQAAAADGTTATAGASASARPGPTDPACQAVGCAHKDPKTTGCGKDARTLQTQVVGKVVVYLRYSQTCRAAWAAITEGQPKDYATITDGTGDSETALIHWGYDNYSPMLNAADPTVTFQVCGYQPAGHDCTAVVSDLAMVVASTPIPIGPASPPPGTGAGAPTAPAPATPADPAAWDPATTPADQPSPTPSLSPSFPPTPVG